jgi:hypothetical protein
VSTHGTYMFRMILTVKISLNRGNRLVVATETRCTCCEAGTERLNLTQVDVTVQRVAYRTK